MRYSEFKKYITRQPFTYTRKLLINLEDLEMYHPENNKRTILVKDPRSYQKNGIWQIYPIATSQKQVHIVCPYCGQIHSHGKAIGTRLPHCSYDEADYNILDWKRNR